MLGEALTALGAQRRELDELRQALADSRLASRQLQRENAALRLLLRTLEWRGAYLAAEACPVCRQERKRGHMPLCLLARALKEAP